MKRGNPTPWRTANWRPHVPFSAHDLACEVPNSVFVSEAKLIFRSPSVATGGLTKQNAYLQIAIKNDTVPGNNQIAIIARLQQSMGSAGGLGPITGIYGGIAGLPAGGKIWLGLGTYDLDTLSGGAPALNGMSPGPIRDSLCNSACVEIRLVGRPAGRVLTLDIEGVVTCGWTY